jgi:hypothetical protein
VRTDLLVATGALDEMEDGAVNDELTAGESPRLTSTRGDHDPALTALMRDRR